MHSSTIIHNSMVAHNKLKEDVLAAFSGDKQFCMLTSMAQQHGHSSLNILLPIDERVEVLQPGCTIEPSEQFCQLICESKEGQKRCSTCRYLIACACHEKQSRYCCHGGISVFASAVRHRIPSEKQDRFLIVTSGPFRRDNDQDHWQSVLKHVKKLPLEKSSLRSSYERLPVIDSETQALLSEIVELAAARMEELLRQAQLKHQNGRSSKLPEKLEDYMFALSLSNEGEMQESENPAIIRLVTGMIKRNPGLLFSVDKIAHAARLTPNYFSALFHKHTGQTFSQFLTEQRLLRAKQLLGDINLNISEVASQSGFTDPNYFSRTFKQKFGTTPSMWRDSKGI